VELSAAQRERYSRQISLPGFGEAGQSRLHGSRVLVAGGDSTAHVAIHYLAAAGVGTIGILARRGVWDRLSGKLAALNPDVEVVVHHAPFQEADLRELIGRHDVVLVTGDEDGSARVLWQAATELSKPVAACFVAGEEVWVSVQAPSSSEQQPVPIRQGGPVPSVPHGIGGCLLAGEAMKSLVGLGSGDMPRTVRFSMADLSFRDGHDVREPRGTEPVGSPETADLTAARLLVVGAGGLGCAAAMHLAAAGVGTIGIVDGDTLELSNLHRQVLYNTDQIGERKAGLAKEALCEMNSEVKVEPHEERVAEANAAELVRDFDVVLACVDNFPTRYVLNDACVSLGKPLVEAAVFEYAGQTITFLPPETSCYRCLFESAPPGGAELPGVLGPVAGLFGTLQAAQAIKLLTGGTGCPTGKLTMFDMLDAQWHRVPIRKRDDCPSCGASRSETG
jgi:molybdopterin/thiamine biosynthesis adenylyltransferase